MFIDEKLEKLQMVEITEEDGIILDLRYATTNNFTGEVIYNNKRCFLRKNTAKKLLYANELLKDYNLKIKVWDAFRSLRAQRKFWAICPDEKFVANPDSGKSNHCKGIAVDVTLCDNNGVELKMPTKFDHFGEESFIKNIENLDNKVKENILLLQKVMTTAGFELFETEWWHFNDSDDNELILEDLN